MHCVNRNVKLCASGLVALLLASARPAGQAPGMTVTPANSTIAVGQTQQFTANGAFTPTRIAGGGYHTCFLLLDRTIRCAGLNNWGQLGNGTNDNASIAVVARDVTTAIDFGAGIEHSCALLDNGTMQCWGTNFVGQLGDGTMGGLSNVPKTVTGLTNAIVAGVGGFHNCAIVSDRTVRCWGRNQDGQIGNGDSTTDVSTPQPVSGLTGVVSLAGGGYHNCALMPDRTMRCWGRNGRGQLGDGTVTSASTPVTVSGMTTAAAITAGIYHTCALLTDGTVQCWGENDSGQIGNTQPFSNVPVTVAGISNVIAVSAGVFHTCALVSGGTVHCWGQNGNGQLGNGTTTNSSSPVQVSGITDAIGIGSAGLHSCALMPDRSARCWGWNAYGQLGSGNNTDSPTPVRVSGTGLTWTSSNPGVATIDAGGRATGVSPGTTTITATDGSGGSASTTLTVGERDTLSVSLAGSGTGTVTSNPAGINCGSDCSEQYDRNTTVTLTAAAAAGSTFTSWNGCDSASGATCTVTMSAARSVTATFDVQRFTLTVGKSGTGSGTVTSNPVGISCGTDCSEPYNVGTTVTLSATPAGGSLFAAWTGCDSVSGATCTVNMNAAKSVSARFDAQTVTLTVGKSGAGSGTVTSNPAGISCGTDCSEPYTTGTSVTLTAAASPGSQFGAWSGCDSASGTSCTVSMSTARSVGAVFNIERFALNVARAGAGTGTVVSSPAGISCGSDCSESYDSGTTITLTATPASGSLFGSWTGCNSVSGTACTVTMNAARSVTATFNLQFFTLTVNKTGAGSGTVTSSPAGIDCGSTCSASFASNVTVTLTPAANMLSAFTGWTGCDSVSGTTCTVRTNAAKSVTASFRLLGIL